MPAVPAAAEEPTPVRDLDQACDARAQAWRPFADVAATGPAADAIGCLAAYRVVEGRFVDGEQRFDADVAVNRQQLASFLAGALALLPKDAYTPPSVTDPVASDADAISTAHRVAVARLQADGIVGGYADGSFRPGATVTRAQLATFVAGAVEIVAGELPRTTAPHDVVGAHAPSVEKLAAIGVVDATADAYRPSDPATRADMALFVARALDHLAAEGFFVRTAFSPAPADNLQGLAALFADARGVAFDVSAGEGEFGWEIRYVDAAISHGSGTSVEVAGDAVLQVYLTGMALPPTLARPTWSGERLAVDANGIVEVVDAGVYEGRQLLFVGTTGRHDFTAGTDADGRLHLVLDTE
ncbi:MAG TPA: S-layer homology domain-containing protein [Egicoccus sp.]|nr:S-layer homology domain-containing protein [Egicoccus sp.]HSK23862.1 S-layer homology domain-containing protein [Egicoccus sp.]